MRLGLSILILSTALLVQAQDPSFEVASIKRSAETSTRLGFQNPPDKLTATNATLRFLIRQAYRASEARITGGPAWLDKDRFDIQATAAPGSAPNSDKIRAMLRTLLTDRFRLKMHIEQREIPVYVLRPVRTDGRLGPNLKVSSTDCTGKGPTMENGRVACGVLVSQGPASASVRGGAARMEEVVRILADFLDRPLLDESGLTAAYDLELQFTAIRSALPGQQTPGGLSTGEPNEIPVVFTAIQEQLGLKLDAQRRTTDIYVIDSVSPPSEN